MNKQAFIVKAYRTAVGKAPKGVFRFKRTDELAAETIAYMMNQLPQLDKKRLMTLLLEMPCPKVHRALIWPV